MKFTLCPWVESDARTFRVYYNGERLSMQVDSMI